MSLKPLRWVRAGTGALSLLFCLMECPLQGETVTNWTQDLGAAPISGENTATVVVGDNTANSADNVAVSGSLSGTLTLVHAGDSIQLTGSVSPITGISGGNNSGDLKFGLFHSNGSLDATGWLGYSMSNSDQGSGGSLLERVNPNTTIYSATTGATQIATGVATPSTPTFTDGTYSFSLKLTLQAGNALLIEYSLIRTSSTGYTLTGSFIDTTASTLSFDRVGFLAGAGLNADQFTLSNVGVTLVAMPEPGSGMMLMMGGLLGVVGRRRRREN